MEIRFVGNGPWMGELRHFEVIDRIGPLMEKLANQSHTCKDACACLVGYAQCRDGKVDAGLGRCTPSVHEVCPAYAQIP